MIWHALAQVPEGASPHDVAACLLAFFAALPRPFMPAAALQVKASDPTRRLGLLEEGAPAVVT